MTMRRTTHLLAELTRQQEHGRLSDGQMLERFLARREEAAFAALVRRHGPMVLGVCRRVLADAHAAEDAFQATFLVLVRKASSAVPRDLVGNWLHGVARRTALKARASAARRRRAEEEASRRRADVTPDVVPDDLRPLLDEEVGRLPERYRAAVVLCVLEGKSRQEAARQLGWSEGTLSGRLARAKALLAGRLARRGVTLSGATLAMTVPSALVAATVQATGAVAAVPAAVLTLTEEVIRAMLMTKVKAVAGVLLLVAGVGAGTGAFAWQRPATGDVPPVRVAAPKKANAKLPAYRIEPPDVLLIEYARRDDDPVNLGGQHLVRPDGTVGLGSLGSVSVNGLTPDEAREAVARHLKTRLDGFDAAKLTLDVLAYNSKFYYVIFDNGGREQVVRLPLTGDETVLDALAASKASLAGIGRRDVSLERRAGAKSQLLPVDIGAILLNGETTTNYLLQAGDRLRLKTVTPPARMGKAEKARADGVTYVSKRTFTIPVTIDPATWPRTKYIRLFMSLNEEHFEQVGTIPGDRQNSFTVTAPEDGQYRFVIRASEDDSTGSTTPLRDMPALHVCVDTQPPKVTLTAVPSGPSIYTLYWEVNDANLDVETLRLRYKAGDGETWHDLTSPDVKKPKGLNVVSFERADTLKRPIKIQLDVRDRAGNAGTAMLLVE